MNNIKNMVDNRNLSEAISNISPEMIQNFSKMLSNKQQTNSNQESDNTNNPQQTNNYNNNNNNNNNNENTNNSTAENNGFDFSNIDMNTVMKMSSMFGKMNNTKNDPRANLLNSLKPYLRDSKKGKLDNYMNLLNVTKIAEIMKDNNKGE